MAGESQAKDIEGVGWGLFAVCAVLIPARLYTRLFLVRQPGWDDLFIVLAMATALVCTALVQVAVHYGYGRHYAEITDPNHKVLAFKYTYLAPPFSILSTMAGRVSIILFMLRLMGKAKTPARVWFLYILTFLNLAANIMAIIILLGFCRPTKRIWLPDTPGTCMSLQVQQAGGLTQAAFNAFTDFVMALFPVAIFWNLKMELKVRLALIAVMGGGIFAAAATAVKTYLLKNLPDQQDITWAWAPIAVWYSAEMYVIIICATIPTLRQFYLQVVRHRIPGYATSRAYGKAEDSRGSIPLSSNAGRKMASGSIGGAGAGSGAHVHQNKLHSQDNSSHEAILHRPDDGGIYKQTDVSVSYLNTRP